VLGGLAPLAITIGVVLGSVAVLAHERVPTFWRAGTAAKAAAAAAQGATTKRRQISPAAYDAHVARVQKVHQWLRRLQKLSGVTALPGRIVASGVAAEATSTSTTPTAAATFNSNSSSSSSSSKEEESAGGEHKEEKVQVKETMATLDAAMCASVDKLDKAQQYDESIVVMRKYSKRCATLAKNGKPSCACEWRMARCYYHKATDVKSISTKRKATILAQGLGHAKRAVKLNERSPDAHKWMAILHNAHAVTQGTKARIRGAHIFQTHTMRAHELAPDCPDLNHMCGRFSYEVANVGYVQKQLAKAMFGGLPQTTFDESVTYFLHAKKHNSKWIMNSLWYV
jgi:hypothetical protein